jgi:hypothetical protein
MTMCDTSSVTVADTVLYNLYNVSTVLNSPSPCIYSDLMKYKLCLYWISNSNGKGWKIESVIVVLVTQSRNFGHFMKPIYSSLPKHNFILITCSTCMQMYRNYWCQKVFVLKVQTAISISVSRRFSSSFLHKELATFKMSYLLESWELDCACHPDGRSMFVCHFGALLL